MKKYIYEHPILSSIMIGLILKSLKSIVEDALCGPTVDIFIIDSNVLKKEDTSNLKEKETNSQGV